MSGVCGSAHKFGSRAIAVHGGDPNYIKLALLYLSHQLQLLTHQRDYVPNPQ